MNTGQTTTSPELSKRLKIAGAKQESKKRYCGGNVSDCLGFCDNHVGCRDRKDGVFSTFDVDTLFERLPTDKSPVVREERCGLFVAYCRHLEHSHTRQCKTPAEALGELYLWCLQEGHCDG